MISYISLERLRFIRKNIGDFSEQLDNEEIIELRNPQQINRDRNIISGSQWGNRAFSISGGALSLLGQPVVGGGIALVNPLVETFISNRREINEEKEKKWNDFNQELKFFCDYCQELTDVTQINRDIDKFGALNPTLKNLKEKIFDFFGEYDKDGNNK